MMVYGSVGILVGTQCIYSFNLLRLYFEALMHIDFRGRAWKFVCRTNLSIIWAMSSWTERYGTTVISILYLLKFD